MFKLFKRKPKNNAVEMAYEILGSRGNKICAMCEADVKCRSKVFCLPLEMILLLDGEEDPNKRLQMLKNLRDVLDDPL